ncbi:MAG TPA: MFS transporter [Kofleriaceae bacterium]|nr:MFS transporter [Kofleriaceae bacterium]
MTRPSSTPPIAIFALVLPYGISSGFVSITLPYLMVEAGFTVLAAAAIVALGVSSNLWRFVGGPIADLTLTARTWYLIGLAACASTLVLLGLVPLDKGHTEVLGTLVFVSQLAATLVVLPVGGLMAHTVADEAKGRAGGWYQAGNLGGVGLGGGAGVWLASHVSREAAAFGLAAAMLVSAAALLRVPEVRPDPGQRIGRRIREMGVDILSMLRSPLPLLSIVLITSPISAGAMSNLWSAVAPDWRASADTVALVNGVLNGVVSALGCVVAGWVADRVGHWWAFFGAGLAVAVAAALIAVAPLTPAMYAGGVILYSATCGMGYATFSVVVLHAIGRGAASTKYAALSSIGNVPVVYMTTLDGWSHDAFGPRWMLLIEGGLGVLFVALGVIALRWITSRTPAATAATAPAAPAPTAPAPAAPAPAEQP